MEKRMKKKEINRLNQKGKAKSIRNLIKERGGEG